MQASLQPPVVCDETARKAGPLWTLVDTCGRFWTVRDVEGVRLRLVCLGEAVEPRWLNGKMRLSFLGVRDVQEAEDPGNVDSRMAHGRGYVLRC
jgi:hypothetical protein